MTTGMATEGSVPRKWCYTPNLPKVTPGVSQKVYSPALGTELRCPAERHNLAAGWINLPEPLGQAPTPIRETTKAIH
ncbi:MAG: hypothetical protein QF721_04400 [Verrucomicrobiota bacterium]|nr:hypothetical protein [Verrucomicrobiota bacterium]MDP7048671.1 hypothetical protein [Verrucomicrobiota bacterium]